MKIALITNDLWAENGWSKYSLDLGEELISKGHEVLFIVSKLSNRGYLEKAILNDPKEYISNPFMCYKTGKKISKILNEFKPEVVHSIVEPYSHTLPWVGNYRKVMTIHGTYSYMPILVSGINKIAASYLTKKMFADLDSIIAVSNLTKKHLVDFLGKNQNLISKIKTVTNGTKIYPFVNHTDNLIPKMLCVGMIKPRKGIKEMLRGLGEFKKTYSTNFICEIIGKYSEEDKYFQEIKRLIKDLELTDNVKLKGTVTEEELKDAYNKMDLYIMTPINHNNDFEGFGLVYLEAASLGVPSIGSKSTGAEEAIKDQVSGYVINPYNPSEIAQAIENILINKKILSKDIRNWALENNIASKTDEILKIYKNA